MRLSRAAVVIAATVVAALSAACTSSGTTAPSSPPPTSAAVTSTSSTPPAPPSSAPRSTPASTPASTPRSTPAHTSSRPHRPSSPAPRPSTPPPSSSSAAPPSGPAPCTDSQLTASGLRGGAYQGREVAGVQFTNSSSTTCTMRGYPFARLSYHGNPLGKPAKDNPGTVRTITLRPGQSAQSQLTAITTCQAPISDHVKVVAPDTTQAKFVPMQLRGCSLSIDPLGAA